MTAAADLLGGASINDVLTTVAALLSAVVFPYLSRREKDIEQRMRIQHEELVKQNSELRAQLSEVTERLLNIVEAKAKE